MSKFVTLHGFGGSGGSELNFDVVAYASEEILLAATPAENTIGIITTTPISSWIFSATEPTGSDGMVFFGNGASSDAEFNALKMNSIQIYPIFAEQYTGSTWEFKKAYLYRNGAWVLFSTEKRYLFKNGEVYESLTGGWSSTGYGMSGFNDTDNSQVTIGNTIVCKALCPGSAADKGGVCGTANKIDKGNYTQMQVKGNVSGYTGLEKLYVGVNTTKTIKVSPTAKISLTADGDFDKTLNLPTSVTSFYVFVLAACYTGTNSPYTSILTVNEIILK